MLNKKIILFCFISVCSVLNAQRTTLQQASLVAEQYYKLLNDYSDSVCKNRNSLEIEDKLHDMFYHAELRTGNRDELVELDLGSSDNKKRVDDNLENYFSQITDFRNDTGGICRVTFHIKIAPDKSFTYGPTNNDTVLIYVDKTIVVDGLFEKAHPEVVSIYKGKIVRVGTLSYTSLYSRVAMPLIDSAKYNDAYELFYKMLEKKWVFYELYDGLVACLTGLTGLDSNLQAPTAYIARENFAMMGYVTKSLWENSVKLGHMDLSVGGIEDLSATLALRTNCYSYISLLGCPDGQTASEGLVVFRDKDLQGYRNLNNEIIIPARFRHAQRFEQGKAAAMKDEGGNMQGKYGLIDRRGHWALKPTYDLIYSMPHYKAYVIRKGNKYGVLGYDGKLLVKPRYDKPVIFLHDDFATCYRDGKWGVVNREGDEVIECKEDQLEIMEVKGTINTASIKYRYNHNKYHETSVFSDGPKIKTPSGNEAMASRWSGGPYLAGNHILMNMGAWIYNLSGLIFGDNLGLFNGTNKPYRWLIPTWTPMYRAPAELSDAGDNSLLPENKLSDFASYMNELNYITYRLGYTISWRTAKYGVLAGLHYEWARWRQTRTEYGLYPQHTVQSIVPSIEIRWLPLSLEFGHTYTFYLGAGLSYVRNFHYKYTGGLFDNWGYESGDSSLKDAINHVWRWRTTLGVAWGYASAFITYERDMNSVFNPGFQARDASTPFAGWESKLGTLGMGATLSF